MNISFTLADLIAVSPLIVLVVASLIPILHKVFNGNREPHPTDILWEGIGGLLAAALALMTVYLLVTDQPNPTAFSGALVMDGKTIVVGILGLLVAAVSLVLMSDHPGTRGSQFSEVTFLTLSAVFGMLILAAANDLLVLFIGLETMSLSLYLMIAISHEQRLAKEAALKYFVLGSLASAVLLYGISFIFGTMGTTALPAIVEETPNVIENNRLYLLGLVMAIVGFAFKVSIVPFHAWTPDVYQGAPTPHAAFMATAVKAATFVAFMRILETNALSWSESLFDLMQWLAVITMTVGNVAAILQNNFKRMLAYSSIAHSGYLLVGLIATGINDPRLVTEAFDPRVFGSATVLFYLVGYSLMTVAAFAVIILLEKNENSIVQIDDFSGFAQRRPWTALGLTVALLSLAGVPPTIGFFGKFYLFSSAMAEGLLWLTLWGVLNSVISAYYYLRPIVVMYMKEGSWTEPKESLLLTRGSVIACAILIVVLGIGSGPLFELIERSL